MTNPLGLWSAHPSPGPLTAQQAGPASLVALAALASLCALRPAAAALTEPGIEGRTLPGCAISDQQLEAAGARIRNIEIERFNVFDLDNPEEDKALFRGMNRLHVMTQPQVVRRQLLFEDGDLFRRQRLDESERILRGTSYLYDARVFVAACDEQSVDVLVRTQDVWSLKPGFSMSRSGGENRLGLDLQEDNFLGRGGSIRYQRRIDQERRTTQLGYADANVAGRWIALDATVEDNSDGHVFDFGLQRPFYSLDTRWAAGGRALDTRREDQVYALGDEIGRFRQDIQYFDFFGGWSGGLRGGWVQRWLAGVVYDNREFANVNDSIDPALVPEDRRLVYPYLEYRLIEDGFLRAENLDQIYRTEDVGLGAEVRLRLGVISSDLGADRSGLRFLAEARRGYGDPARQLWSFSTHAHGRIENGEFRNTIVGGAARWYLRQSERRLLYASLRADVAEALDLDNPLEIGGDDGLRGYPLRYQRGDARAQFTLEQRYFTDYYLWRLFRVGGAIFFDAGRVWGDNPYGGENLGLLRDVGFGLRLAGTRSSIGKMIHIDFAFPLDGDESIDSFQFLIEGRRSF